MRSLFVCVVLAIYQPNSSSDCYCSMEIVASGVVQQTDHLEFVRYIRRLATCWEDVSIVASSYVHYAQARKSPDAKDAPDLLSLGERLGCLEPRSSHSRDGSPPPGDAQQ